MYVIAITQTLKSMWSLSGQQTFRIMMPKIKYRLQMLLHRRYFYWVLSFCWSRVKLSSFQLILHTMQCIKKYKISNIVVILITDTRLELRSSAIFFSLPKSSPLQHRCRLRICTWLWLLFFGQKYLKWEFEVSTQLKSVWI